MPLPSPKKGEAKDKFTDRCMGNKTMNKDYPDESQRRAVCESQWDRGNKAEANLGHIIDYLGSTVWAILPDTLDVIHGIVDTRLHEGKLSDDEIEQRLQGQDNQGRGITTTEKGVRVIPIRGVIAKRMNLFIEISGGTSVEILENEIKEALADEDVKSIMLDVESPGGAVDGPFELSDFIFSVRGQKPIHAFANGQMTSAAYLIGSATDNIMASQTALVGSIGVVTRHKDYSKQDEKAGIKTTYLTAGKYKRIVHDAEPLSKEGRGYLQEKLDYFYSMFIDSVARNRGITTKKVLAMADGQIFIGEQAKNIGLVDSIGTFDESLCGCTEIISQEAQMLEDADLFLTDDGHPIEMAKKDKDKPGGSNVDKYKKGPFCGPSGGAPKGTYPVNTKKRAKAALSYARHAPNPSGIVKCVCRHWSDLPKCKKKKGVKAQMNKEQLREQYPDDYEAIAEAFAGDVTDLEQEKATLIREKKSLEDKLKAEQGEKGELLTKLAKAEGRLDALEAESDKRKTLDREGKMKTEADAIWKKQLDKSEIPERLHDKAMDQVKFGQFIKGKDEEQALDVEAFTAAVEAELADPAWKIEESSVLGAGAAGDRSVDGDTEKVSAEDEEVADRMYKKTGGKDNKE